MTRNEFDDWRSENHNDYSALINFAYENGCEDCVESIISADDVNAFVARRFESGDWQGVACCISDIIDSLNEDYYEIDGYENLQPISDWDSYADEIEDNIDFDEVRCEMCEDIMDDDDIHTVDEWISRDDVVDRLQITDDEKKKLSRYDYGRVCIDCFEDLLSDIRQ